MKINIYYGGRGLINDPTLYVMNKMQEVLEELRVTVERFYLQELKNNITTLPQTLKDADGIILASTVEWYGIGGYMQQFLDACWLYGDKEKIGKIYMCPIVMSTTYGEREGKLNLATAWEILGGRPCSGICGYIPDTTELETNKGYLTIIEKKAENMYRTINQKMVSFPSSNQAVKNTVSSMPGIELTPQESEQLSQYVSDDVYMQTQKTDIQELTSLFKDMMEDTPEASQENKVAFERAFKPQQGLQATYKLFVGEGKTPLTIVVNGDEINCDHDDAKEADVEIRLDKPVLVDIFAGKMSFQRAFMAGEMKMKGEFRILRAMDQIFVFQ